MENDYTQLQGRVFDDYVLDQLVYWIVIGLNVDENGEEIPLPEVKVSSFIKMEKLK